MEHITHPKAGDPNQQADERADVIAPGSESVTPAMHVLLRCGADGGVFSGLGFLSLSQSGVSAHRESEPSADSSEERLLNDQVSNVP